MSDPMKNHPDKIASASSQKVIVMKIVSET